MKELKNSLVEFLKLHGVNTLNAYFDSQEWLGFAKILEDHLDDARDQLEIESDLNAICYIQGQANALRTILDLADITVDVAKQLKAGMPDEKPTREDEDDERPVDRNNLI